MIVRGGLAVHPGILERGVEIDNECFLTVIKLGRGGYAKWGSKLAHRVAFEFFHGPIAPGMQVGHLCHDAAYQAAACAGGVSCVHRRCVNVSHLAEQTPRENNRAAGALSAGAVARVRFVDGRCQRGHVIREGYRKCHECSAARGRRFRERRRADAS